eukprot:10459814-Alexandrium_andersonii.AAC.1
MSRPKVQGLGGPPWLLRIADLHAFDCCVEQQGKSRGLIASGHQGCCGNGTFGVLERRSVKGGDQ